MSRAPVALGPLPGLARPLELHTHPPEHDLVSRRLHEQRCWEPFETRLLLACLERGSTACDVGANLGYFTVAMALAARAPRRVFAFEPAADNFALLRRNVDHNDCESRVTAEHAALGVSAGTVTLHRSADNRGDHQLMADAGDRERETVQQLRGDQYFSTRAERLNVVKIDTQGTEMAVVEGLWQTLRASRDGLHLLVELTPFSLQAAGSSGRALVERLAELDLPLAIVDHVEERVVPESAAALAQWCDNVDATPGDEGFMNIFVGEVPSRLR